MLIDKNLTIQGPGANLLTVTRSAAGGKPQFRGFHIPAGATVNISGLTISNGNTVDGGGLLKQGGTAALTDCAVTGNGENREAAANSRFEPFKTSSILIALPRNPNG